MAASLDVKVLANPADSSKPFALLSTITTIGRDKVNSICLDDKFISRKHARLERRGSIFRITDLSSSGTWVNGQRLEFGPDGTIELNDADVRACHTPADLPALVSLRYVVNSTGSFPGLCSRGRTVPMWREVRPPSRAPATASGRTAPRHASRAAPAMQPQPRAGRAQGQLSCCSHPEHPQASHGACLRAHRAHFCACRRGG